MIATIQAWLKKAALEVQEYVYLTAAALSGAASRPFYRHDLVEQLDTIGVGSLTVVLLTGGPTKKDWWSSCEQPSTLWLHVEPSSSDHDRRAQLTVVRSSSKMREVAGST